MNSAQTAAPYPIGMPGTPWGAAEKALWLSRQRVQRSYADEVVAPLKASLPAQAELFSYGHIDYARLGQASHALYAVRSRHWNPALPSVLVTGGVHGYETSGVQGALQWLRECFDAEAGRVNLLVLPCISPWAYETINRWNPEAIDPNRQFRPHSPALESALAMACVAAQASGFDLHVDLHETTDSDEGEFRPAKAARDGEVYEWHAIPDGFYLVADSERPAPEFQKALIEAVRRVTHITEADAQGGIIGSPLQQWGVIEYPKRSLGLCGAMTAARYVTTTEVYPDSATASPAECNAAQMATVSAAIEFLLRG